MFPIYFWILTTPLGCSYWQAEQGIKAFMQKYEADQKREDERNRALDEAIRKKAIERKKSPAKP